MDSKSRFSSRVESYTRYRPGYPSGIIDVLRLECGLTERSAVADIGSGTGLLSRLFLDAGCRVYGVEPNGPMREAGERELAQYPNFHSMSGSAEETGLPDTSFDFFTAGQAFHWFDPARARAEALRILRPGGWVVLVWNERRLDTSPFLRAYENLLKTFAIDYDQVNHRGVEEDTHIIPGFFGGEFKQAWFDYVQHFDYSGVEGRLLSSSFVPEAGHPSFQPMLEELRKIFEQTSQNGAVSFEYDTHMFYGQLI